MPELVRAGGPIAERIIKDTYPIWNEGLSLDGYRRWNDLQTRTAWGQDSNGGSGYQDILLANV